MDNLEQLVDSSSRRYDNEKALAGKIAYLFDCRKIVSESIAYLQGRTIIKQWVILDEAQNSTPSQMKNILTRAGEGTKIVVVGDPNQPAHPFLDQRTNGLTWIVEHMKSSKLHAHINLTETKRSALAGEVETRTKM